MNEQASSNAYETDNMKKLLAQLQVAQRKLVETGTRNRLIHVNRKTNRANVINIINERSDDVFRILKQDGKRMQFWATGTDKKPSDDDQATMQEVILAGDRLNDEPDEERYTDNKLETKLGPDAQQKRLLKIHRDSKSAEEEQGINILYLALGFLRWFEDRNSDVEREAPLILLPVNLVRNHRTSTYDLVMRDDEIVTNLPLKEKLEQDFGLVLPEIENPDDEGWTPSTYFEMVEEAISSREQWSLDHDGMQLGFFSFAKLLMLRDLNPENWPENGLLNSELLSALLNATFEADSPLFKDDDNLDRKLDPADIFHVLDADRSQAIVIEEVRKGRNLVVQGPPGTGKSQTITNIIAAAVHDGKTVLFVAEKMAALSVVHDRLKKAGLEHVALELHSRKANKRSVLEELGRTLNDGHSVPNIVDNVDAVRVPRDKLNAIADTLHSPVPGCQQTPFQAMAVMSAMKGKGANAPSFSGDGLTGLSDSEIDELCAQVRGFAETLETDLTPIENPYRGFGRLDLQPLDIERLGGKASELSSRLRRLVAIVEPFKGVLGFSKTALSEAKSTFGALLHASEVDEEIKKLVPILSEHVGEAGFETALVDAQDWFEASKASPFLDAALAVPAGQLRVDLGAGVGSFFSRLGSAYRAASQSLRSLLSIQLPKEAERRVALADQLIALQEKYKKFGDSEPILRSALGGSWTGDSCNIANISAARAFVNEFKKIAPSAHPHAFNALIKNSDKTAPRAALMQSLYEQISPELEQLVAANEISLGAAFGVQSSDAIELPELIERLELMSTQQQRYDIWRQYSATRQRLINRGLTDILARLEEGTLTKDAADQEIRYARAEAAWQKTRRHIPELDALSDLQRHELVDQFMQAEKSRITTIRKLVASEHLNRVPSGAVGEMGFIRQQISRKRGHAPIRKLMETAGPVIQRIRPVFLMSPISVAQFLPPWRVDFDILVIDEASQVKPEDALGAIARARQIVIVGDQKQLPPTAFFDKMTSNIDDDEDDDTPLEGYATEAESILSLCDARQLPSRMLTWHYRSRDPSLIKVSNVEFYDHKLVLPPSPLEKDEDYGLRFIRVDGVYTPRGGVEGKPGTNIIEAERLVEAVKQHARQSPDLSLGIATFNIAQRDCVNEVLERERREDASLDDFLREGSVEDVFVKNIENVQGDERDVIMISVGYGPRLSGQRLASTNFGPVNKEGGHRRLNVLFSRARVRCDVFCSFDPGDISTDGCPDGVRVFKRYLDFAKTGIVDEATANGGAPDSPFESDVGGCIRDLGYTVDHQVGTGGFLIDLGVVHPERPGQYMLAVECDGATYHSSLWSRERDRLRQEVLENLGWRFHRIWSTDWFLRRESEKERLRSVLEACGRDSNPGGSIKGANREHQNASPRVEPQPDQQPKQKGLLKPKAFTTPYVRANVSFNSSAEPHNAGVSATNQLVAKIVLEEGPLHQDEIARRFAGAFGKQKTGRRIVEAVQRALNRQKSKNISDQNGSMLICQGDFWMTEGQAQTPRLRNRSAESGTSVYRADMLPPVEIAGLAKAIAEDSGSVPLAELVTSVARELGFERTGPDLRAAIEASAKQFSNAAN